MRDLRSAIRNSVRGLVGSDELDLTRPPGDPGLFGPGSAVWAVHSDFTAMMIGGFSALLLQMLHPAALAGVWDHSDFRRDALGRLKRTAQFISVTTFGPTEAAEARIARVRAIHDRVAGTLPDGTPYRAVDPALLTWVHVAEADSFLRAHLRYRNAAFPAAEQDRYLSEMATLAERLGARDVPTTRAEVAAYFARMRPALHCDTRTRIVADTLIKPQSFATAPASALVSQAALDLLPSWARAMHRRRMPMIGRPAVRLGANGLGQVLRWALAH